MLGVESGLRSGWSALMLKMPSAREMGWIAVAAWLSALVMLSAALKFGGAARLVAAIWIAGATVWTLVAILRGLSQRERE